MAQYMHAMNSIPNEDLITMLLMPTIKLCSLAQKNVAFDLQCPPIWQRAVLNRSWRSSGRHRFAGMQGLSESGNQRGDRERNGDGQAFEPINDHESCK